jgi:hypothetical protein
LPQSAIESDKVMIEHLDEFIKGNYDKKTLKAAISDSNNESRQLGEFSGAIVPIYSLNEPY